MGTTSFKIPAMTSNVWARAWALAWRAPHMLTLFVAGFSGCVHVGEGHTSGYPAHHDPAWPALHTTYRLRQPTPLRHDSGCAAAVAAAKRVPGTSTSSMTRMPRSRAYSTRSAMSASENRSAGDQAPAQRFGNVTVCIGKLCESSKWR